MKKCLDPDPGSGMKKCVGPDPGFELGIKLPGSTTLSNYLRPDPEL
jgi:hypothetical protein